MMTYESVLEDIRPIVADVLAVDVEEVTPSSRFFEDLGGESIDVLDLSFQLERRFGVRVRLQELAAPGELATDSQGRLTSAALSQLRTEYPFLDFSRLEEKPTRESLTGLLSIGAFAHFVISALDSAREGPAEVAPGERKTTCASE